MRRAPDLSELLLQLDPQASLVQRHLWLAELVRWIRGDATDTGRALDRLALLFDGLAQRPASQDKFRQLWRTLLKTVDATALLADFGFASRAAFVSELGERLILKWLPRTPETVDAATLFQLVFDHPFDAQWLGALAQNDALLARTAALLDLTDPAAPVTLASPDGPAVSAPAPQNQSPWQAALLEATIFCTSQIRATGFNPELRQRMSAPARDALPFHALDADLRELHQAYLRSPHTPTPERAQALHAYSHRLELCRHAAASVYTHLEAHGISVSLVFQLRQLRDRTHRARSLLDCLLHPQPLRATATLIAHLVDVGQQRRSVRALLAANSSMLAAKVAERSSETGEHYITRTRAEYRAMLRDAAGGGGVMALTTGMKFVIVGLGLSTFWGGFFAGLNYAASFVLIQLLHWTVATKQPAMTAPAMAAKLKELDSPGAVARFVDEVAHLVRSQMAAIAGNLALVAPAVLLLSAGLQALRGQPLIDAAHARHVLHDLTLLGPTALFAGVTGVLLFASSILAGWAENWFVLHRLDSALRYNPRITRVLGGPRAQRWSAFLRRNLSGFAANVSLGLMLGLVPAFATFFGLGLEVRHVTLSTGQLAAAAASLGTDVLREGAFWWCVAALAATGLLNVGVSFYLAFRVALRAHNVSGVDRARIQSAIIQRLRSRPRAFFWPEPEPPTEAAGG
jgi:site-specific recombinase